MNEPELSLWSQLKSALRLALDDLARLPTKVTRWARDRHGPFDVLDDQSLAICRVCNVEWPCDEWVRLDDELRASEETP